MNPSERLVELLSTLPSAKNATERKRSIETIEDLLTKEDVCLSLEQRSTNSNGPNWKSVFNAVAQFVSSDLENIAKCNPNTSISGSSRSAFNPGDRAKEHVSMLKTLLERMEAKTRLPYYVAQKLAEGILFLAINQPYNFPPDCVCSHIRLFERFVLKAGRRLIDLNQSMFHDLLRQAAVNCCYFDTKKSPYVQPAVRVHLAGLAVGLLRFSAEDLFPARPSIVCSLYSKYFLSINEPNGAELEILQKLAGALPDACQSLREYPQQLRNLVVEIIPKLVNLFAIHCQGSKLGTDSSFITACHYIVANLPNFIADTVPNTVITKLWDATTKAMEDLVARFRFQSTSSTRRTNVPTLRANVNKALCDLYVAVAHFRLVKHTSDETIIVPPSCSMLASSSFWLSIATRWLQLHPGDIPPEFICNWCQWASAVLSKPSKLSLHADVLSLVLEALKSPNCSSLSLPIYSQLWTSVQKAFSPSTVETVFQILHLLMPVVFAHRNDLNPTLSIPVPQLFAHPAVAVPFLLYFFTFDPPLQQRRGLATLGTSLQAELLAHLDSMGSDLFNSSNNQFDLVSLSQLLLFLLTEEVVVAVGKESPQQTCPHSFFTSNVFTNDMYDPCALLLFSNNVTPPENAKSHWRNGRIDSEIPSTCQSCPLEIDVSYVKVVENLQDCLEKRFNSANLEECFVKLSFISNLSLAGPLLKLGLLEYATKLAVDFSVIFAETAPEQSLSFSKALYSYLSTSCRAKSPEDRQILLGPFLSASFTVDFLFQRVFDAARNFADKGPSLGDVTLILDESSLDSINGDSSSNNCDNSDKLSDLSVSVKPQNDLPIDQVRFLSDLRLLVLLFNLKSEDLNEKMELLLKKIQHVAKPRARNVFFNTMAVICGEMKIASNEIYSTICQTLWCSLKNFVRDQHLVTLNISLARQLLLQNSDKMGCQFENFKPFICPLTTLNQQGNLTTVTKLQLLNFLCEVVSKSDQPDSLYFDNDAGGIVRFRDVLLTFLADQSMTVRLAAIKCLSTIVRSSSIVADFFDAFLNALNQSLRISGDVRPTDEEINEERDNRSATFLLALARTWSVHHDEFADCQIASLATMFRLSFDPVRVSYALFSACQWSDFSNHVFSFLEPISGALSHFLVNETIEDPVTLEKLLAIFFPKELVESGLLEAFLVASLKRDPHSDVLRQCSSLPDLKDAPGVDEIVARVHGVNSVLSGRAVVNPGLIETSSNSDLAEIAVRTIVTCNRYISDQKMLTSLIDFILGNNNSGNLAQAMSQRRGFVPSFLAAFDKRLLLVKGGESNFSPEILRIYVMICRQLLKPPLKDTDFVMAHGFKTVLTALTLATSSPRPETLASASFLLDQFAIPVLMEVRVFKAYSLSEFVAPLIVAAINFLSNASSKQVEAFPKAKELIFELEKCDATTMLVLPFVDCFAENWFPGMSRPPSGDRDMCRHVRKACRSLLRHNLTDLHVPIDRVLNVWSCLAERRSDQKLASLLFQLALRNQNDQNCNFKVVSTTLPQLSLVHKCGIQGQFQPNGKTSEESEELFAQAVIILSQLRHLLIFPSSRDSIENPLYWQELVANASNILASIPLNVVEKLPLQLSSFFALFPTAAKVSSRNNSMQDTNGEIDSSIWTCPNEEDFPKWTCQLAVYLVKLLTNNSLLKNPSAIDLVSKHCKLAQQLLPRIIVLLLKYSSKNLVNGTLEFLAVGFSNLLRDALAKRNQPVLSIVLELVLSLRKEAVATIRKQNPPQLARTGLGGRFCISDETNIVGTTRPLSNCLGLDWWHLAQAADICGSPAHALMYGQLYFETNLLSEPVKVVEDHVIITSSTLTQLSNESRKLSVLARNSVALGNENNDIVAGLVAVSDWSQRDLRFLHYSITHQWSKALSISNRSALTAEIRFNSGDIIDEDDNYQLMWKLADWNRLSKTLSVQDLASPGPDAAVYTALSALNDSVVASCRTSGAECLSKMVVDTSIRNIMKNLTDQKSKLVVLSHLSDMIGNWPTLQSSNRRSNDEDGNFLNAAIHVLRSKMVGTSPSMVFEATKAVADLCSNLVLDGKPMLAAKILQRHQPPCQSLEFDRLVRLIDAQSAWAVGETRQAVSMLGGLLVDIRNADQHSTFLQSTASQLFAKWNMDVNLASGNVDTIQTLRSLLNAHITKSNAEPVSNVEMYTALASYCEHRYRQLDTYIKSPSFVAKSTLTQQIKEELGELKENSSKQQPGGSERTRYMAHLQGFERIGQYEIDLAYRQRDDFLKDALTSFLQVMRYSPLIEDIVAYRVVGLWISNDDKDDVVRLVSGYLPKIASSKFVPLFYQIAARYCSASASINSLQSSKECLRNLLLRTTAEHPYHTLPVLILLSDNNNSSNNGNVTSPSTKRSAKRPRLEPAPNLACQLLDTLKQTGKKMETLVEAYQRLCQAYVEFSTYDVTAHKNERCEVAIPDRFFKKSHLEPPLPLLTRPPSLQFTTNSYEIHPSFVTLQSVDRKLRLLGGVNVPKLIRCRGSDGRLYQQLVKGANDDLRQDAVMQQVFKVVNALFSASSPSFVMRTYPIIPLSNQPAGVIGFCDSTISLGNYLIGRGDERDKVNGAHCYYRPGDWSFWECRNLVHQAAAKGSPTEKRVQVLRDIYANFKPVFRFYFIDNFPDPVEFCRQRRTYGVSLGVASMVGYILGLGDRHLYNILLDINTSEVVHIDLGVAFEQGRTLSIPETVPFRLTRDLVDGLGPTGVEGTFRKSCEAALTILEKNREAIMTVLEVFSYDPLHLWTLNPLKASRLQQNQMMNPAFFGGTSTTNRTPMPPPSPMPSRPVSALPEMATIMAPYRVGDNQMANRVLFQVGQKLAGEVSERGLKLSVPEQVEWLIQQATSLNNLAVIYHGWQAYV